MDWNKKVALVTGGASGLGGACVRLFSKLGAKVVIADRDVERGTALAKSLGAGAVFLNTDVTDEAQVQIAIDTAWSQFKSLDVVVNCAGIGHAVKIVNKELEPMPLAQFKKVIEINLIGSFNVDRLAAASIIKNKPGTDALTDRAVFIHTASVAAFDGQMGQTAYSASKGGIVGMTLPMARDLARSGIRVVTIAPGTFDTPLLAALPENARASLAQQVPFPSRLGNPDEFAFLAQHIVENQMINGEVIRLDGALRMGVK